MNQNKKVDTMKNVLIGGTKQYILERGDNKDNPVILFLHGGPGTAQIGFMPNYQALLEKHFLVVNWDQRGSGLSYSKNVPKDTMNLKNFISDAFELIEYLKDTYQKEKIFLVGHSWGSLLGMHLIHLKPELFYGYIGIGQIANMAKAEEYIYDYLLVQAKREENKEAIDELKEIGKPPYKEPFKSIPVSRKWVNHYKGITWKENLNEMIVDGMKHSSYYKESDINRWVEGSNFSVINMLGELLEANLKKDITSVDIPVYFFGGRHDLTTPSVLAYEYLTSLNAPKKEYVWFEESAHMPMMEEYITFQNEVIKIFHS